MNAADLNARALSALVPPGQVVELRAPRADIGRQEPGVVSGFYSDPAKLIADASRINADGVYFTLNPVNPDLLARRNNRCGPLRRGETSAADKDITRRRLLFVDVDPVRLAGIPATNAEKAHARAVTDAVADYLRGEGWPAPLVIDSGNGFYLLYLIDLPADDGGIVAGCLKELARRFDTAAAHIDTGVFNPARIVRLPGTMNRKGDGTPDRPHRPCVALSVPDVLQVVPVDLLAALAASARAEEPKATSARTAGAGNHAHRLAVGEYLAHYGAEVLSTNTGADGQKRWRIVCPFNPDHTGTDAYVCQYPNGATGFHCSHNSCAGNKWEAFKAKVGRPLPEHYDPPKMRVQFGGSGLRIEAAQGVATSTAFTASTAPGEAEPEDTPSVKPAEWPDPIGAEAYYGLAGEIVNVLDPGSEADPVGVLGMLLAMSGNAFGRRPHYRISGSFHRCNLNLVAVGLTGTGRKGTAGDMVRLVFEGIDDEWLNGRIMEGLSSGEGLLWAIRDPITKRVEVKQRGCSPTFEDVEADPGVSDKRLLVVEPEYANVLKVQERQGSTLSPVIRKAWDSPPVLQTMTKNNPAKASEPHVSIIGHITGTEFTRCLPSTEVANGGANRSAILCVRRSKVLPDGGTVDPARLARVREKLRKAVAFAKTVDEVKRHPDAAPLWHGVYELLTSGGGGLHGSLTARAAPIVLRVAMVYALLDLSRVIRPAHLMAAIAFWDYCDRSTAFLFADRTGNPLADEIRDQLRAAPNGMTRTEIQTALGKHQFGDRLTQALQALELAKLARREKEKTAGRSAERWFASAGAGLESQLMTIARRLFAECGESGESGESPPIDPLPSSADDPFAAFTASAARRNGVEAGSEPTSTAFTAYTASPPTDWNAAVLKELKVQGTGRATSRELHERVNRAVPVTSTPPILADVEEALGELVAGGKAERTGAGIDADPFMYRLARIAPVPSFKPVTAPWRK